MSPKTPLYYTIMEEIKEDILIGKYPVDTLLPTETEFESIYDVSKITIRKAIELLETDGYVNKKSGRGTTVVSNSLYNKLSKGESFSHILNDQGFKVTKRHTTFKRITITKAHPAFPFFGKKTVQMDRMYYIDETPYIYMEHFFANAVKTPRKIEDDNAFSLYTFLYSNEYRLKSFEDSFTISKPSEHIQKALGLDDVAVLTRTRRTYSELDEVVEISFAYYNTAIHPYQINYLV